MSRTRMRRSTVSVMVDVDVEIDDVLAEIDTETLEAELAERRKRTAEQMAYAAGEPWTLAGAAEDLRTAFYARNASRFEGVLSSVGALV